MYTHAWVHDISSIYAPARTVLPLQVRGDPLLDKRHEVQLNDSADENNLGPREAEACGLGSRGERLIGERKGFVHNLCATKGGSGGAWVGWIAGRVRA